MKDRLLVTLIVSGLLCVSSGSAGIAQTYVPQQSYQPPAQYNTAPQYQSVPQYNAVPQYNTVPQYNSVPQYNTVPQYNAVPPGTTFQPVPAAKQGFQNLKPAWFQALTENREHDFGVVARASKQEHLFEFENTTGSDLFLTGVRTSCGCTKPKILTNHVKPGEKAMINAAFDTLNFFGSRGATVTVSLQKSGLTSEFGEVQFSVKGNIRRDVVLNPGEIAFNDVTVSEQAQRTVRVSYAGDPQWKIVEVKSTNPNVAAEVREVERNPQSKRVAYDLVVKLAEDQAAGPFSEFLTIVTNDAKTTGMPVLVKGLVKPVIEVSSIQLGVVNKGQTIQKKLILRCSRPISIKEIIADDPRIKFEAVVGEKTLHMLTYSLDTTEPGQIDEEVTILTSDPSQPETKVPFSVQIVPATVAGADQ